MKLHYYKPDKTNVNFGDEINKDLWNHFFPNFFDKNKDEVFFGIGTIMRAAHKFYPKSKIIIFGSGAHAPNFDFKNETKIYCVRGPLSAKSLGLNNSYAITDPAILINEIYKTENLSKKYDYGFIPHFSAENEDYKDIVTKAGFHFISPNQNPKYVVNEINKCKVIITEAMHGAIVADTYNIPWIPVFTYASFNFFKWNDWASSLGMNVIFKKLPRIYKGEKGWKASLKKVIFRYSLKKISKSKTYLSSDDLKQKRRNQLKLRIDEFKEDYNIT